MEHPSIRVGRIEVVPLCDGWAALPLAHELPGHPVDWAAERERHPWAFDPRGGAAWAWHVHAFLVRLPAGPVLVDTGIGHLGRPPYDVTGRIEDALRAAGVGPHEVRHVVHTHLHADHAGGACRPDGEPRFPNAVHHVHPADWAFFAAADDPDDARGHRALRHLEELGMLDLRDADAEVTPGVHVVHSPGHTPGHRSVIVTDASDTLLLTGDLLHLPVQVAHPEWASGHDEEPDLGIASRVRLLDQARERRWQVGVSHFGSPFGAVTRVEREQRWTSRAPA